MRLQNNSPSEIRNFPLTQNQKLKTQNRNAPALLFIPAHQLNSSFPPSVLRPLSSVFYLPFPPQRFLVYGLKESMSQFLMHFHRTTYNSVCSLISHLLICANLRNLRIITHTLIPYEPPWLRQLFYKSFHLSFWFPNPCNLRNLWINSLHPS